MPSAGGCAIRCTLASVHFLEEVPNAVKVALVALVVIVLLAVVLYLQFRPPGRRD